MNISKKSFIYQLVLKYNSKSYPIEDSCELFAQFMWCLCKLVVKYLLIMLGMAGLICILILPFIHVYFNYEIPTVVAILAYALYFVCWLLTIVLTGIYFIEHTDKELIWQQDIHTFPIIKKLCFKITFTD